MEELQLWPGGRWSDDTRLSRIASDSPATGDAGVLVLPGGGYTMCAAHEGEPVAQKLAGHGLHAAVLVYRHAPQHRHPAPGHDVLRAIRVLRQAGWRRVAVLGFSAGGHLAATAAVHHQRFRSDEDDLADKVSAKPDAAVLCYPVIDLETAAAHAGSRRALLGDAADQADLVRLMSLQQHVTADAPPMFIWHTVDDAGVPVENALLMTAACRVAGVPVELHAYETGPHGVGLADGTMGRLDDPSLRTWFDHAVAFLHRHLAG